VFLINLLGILENSNLAKFVDVPERIQAMDFFNALDQKRY
jgi:hypothetical protein